MAPFIQWYSDVQLQPLVTPAGNNWYADDTILVGGIQFDRTIAPLFPYLNALLEKAIYLTQPPFIRFRYEGVLCALHPHYLAAFPFDDRPRAESFFRGLVAFLNDVDDRKASIRPNHKAHNPVSVLEILKLLPRNNCRQCGYATCMAFAGAVRTGRSMPQKCPELATPLMEKAVYPVYDDQGQVVDTVDIEISSSQRCQQLSQQQDLIADMEQRIATLIQQTAKTDMVYDPPFGIELSDREMEVLRLMGHGTTNPEISEILSISPHTVKSHVIHIFNKLGVNDRTQAAVWAARNGII